MLGLFICLFIGFGLGIIVGLALFALVIAAAGAVFLFLGLHHQRLFDDRFLAADRQVTQHGVIEAEDAFELGQGGRITLDVHQNIVCFVQLGDGERQLAPAPVFQAMDGTAVVLDQGAVTFQHGRNLLALVRVDQKTDFVVSHCDSLWICQRECRATKASP